MYLKKAMKKPKIKLMFISKINYIYIYIERERERERELDWKLLLFVGNSPYTHHKID